MYKFYFTLIVTVYISALANAITLKGDNEMVKTGQLSHASSIRICTVRSVGSLLVLILVHKIETYETIRKDKKCIRVSYTHAITTNIRQLLPRLTYVRNCEPRICPPT
jgi:hypothetical protein